MKKGRNTADRVRELVEEYKEKYSLFDDYTKTIRFLLEKLLNQYGLQVQTIQFRTKEMSRFNKKLVNNEYLLKRKLVEMPDLSGCRVIFYIEESVGQFAKILYKEFDVVDDDVKLSPNEYNARHITVKLKHNRYGLFEYSKFRELRCEIQLTTILYHAWAEIEHDILYKPNEQLLEFDKQAFDSLRSYSHEIMEQHLKPASQGFSFIVAEFGKIQHGQQLINPATIDAKLKSLSNNELYNFLKLLNQHLVKYAHKLPKEYSLIKSLETALESAKKNPIVDRETIFGTLKGFTYLDIADEILNILDTLRYYDIINKLRFIIKLAKQKDLEPKCEAILGRMVEYNIRTLKRYGFYVQNVVLDYISKQKSEHVLENFKILLGLIAPIASLECTDSSMSAPYQIVSTRGCLQVSDALKNVRTRYFEETKKFFEIANTDFDKRDALRAMFSLTAPPHFKQMPEDVIVLLSADGVKITDYLITCYDSTSNFIKKDMQQFMFKLERLPFKDNFVNLVRLKKKIENDLVFQKFSVLYGNDVSFYSNFDFKAAQEFRKQKIREFVQQIQEENIEEWYPLFEEILDDYAFERTGPYTYFSLFLRKLAEEKPKIALKLVNKQSFLPFLNIILTGLLDSSEQKQVKKLLIDYAQDSTKQLATVQAILSKRDFDESLFSKVYPVLIKSTDTTVLFTLLQTILNNYHLHKNHKEKVTCIISKFTNLGFHSWSFVYYASNDFWKEASEDNVNAILENLKYCNDIGYDEGAILSAIGEKNPKRIITFFHERLNLSKANTIGSPIPFELFLIKDSLSRNSKEILPEIMKWFSDDDSLANWHASSLIERIFPSFNSDLERILLTLIKSCDKNDLQIVLHILNKYGGKPFTHEIIKEIVKTHTIDEKLKTNLFFSMSAVPEVTQGDYGFYNKLQLKKEEIKNWSNDPSAKIRAFANEYQKHLDTLITAEKERVEKEILFRNKEFEITHK